jgi:hypothetical protein
MHIHVQTIAIQYIATTFCNALLHSLTLVYVQVRAALFKICPEVIKIHKNLDNQMAIIKVFSVLEREIDPFVVPQLWQSVLAIVCHLKVRCSNDC